MRRATRSHTGLLVALTLALCATPPGLSRAVVRAGASAVEPSAEVAQAGGAVEEREQGRALLRRGKAGEALVHLERALKSFQQAGDKSGEASARDLIGELYERQGRYDVALQNYDAAYDLYAALAAGDARQGQLAGALSTQENAYNSNLMLAKIGQMYYRRGDADRAREAFGRMRVTRPETDQLKAAQNSKSSAESKASKARGFGARIRGALGGTPSTSTPGAAVGVVTDISSDVKGPFNAYRETVIYTTYELGMGRVEYLKANLDEAKKHFQNVLDATLTGLPLVGRLGQTRRYRTAARTSRRLPPGAVRRGREVLRRRGPWRARRWPPRPDVARRARHRQEPLVSGRLREGREEGRAPARGLALVLPPGARHHRGSPRWESARGRGAHLIPRHDRGRLQGGFGRARGDGARRAFKRRAGDDERARHHAAARRPVARLRFGSPRRRRARARPLAS